MRMDTRKLCFSLSWHRSLRYTEVRVSQYALAAVTSVDIIP